MSFFRIEIPRTNIYVCNIFWQECSRWGRLVWAQSSGATTNSTELPERPATIPAIARALDLEPIPFHDFRKSIQDSLLTTTTRVVVMIDDDDTDDGDGGDEPATMTTATTMIMVLISRRL